MTATATRPAAGLLLALVPLTFTIAFGITLLIRRPATASARATFSNDPAAATA
jgi:hypothetical protein